MDIKTLTSSIQKWLNRNSPELNDNLADNPIPTELFTVDQLERHGVLLALSHKLVQKSAPDILLSRLSFSEDILVNSCNLLAEKGGDGFTPAREWLLDNFYLIQEQIHSIKHNLPKKYGRELPQLTGDIKGYPRVYALALAVIEHSDGRWDLEQLSRFITAYQSITKLTLGELWAIPITLSVALIEFLSRVSKWIVNDKNDHKLANQWADLMLEVISSEPKKLVTIIADMAKSEPSMSSAFVTEFARRLQGSALLLPLSWIEHHLAEDGLTIEQLVQEENKRQAANQVTVSNIISSLRRLKEVNWRDFVEAMSIVEHTLQRDPIAIYGAMDFDTRDQYRHVVEQLARESHQSEEHVALLAIDLAKTTHEKLLTDYIPSSESSRFSHVGYYLIDKGLLTLEKELQVSTFWKKLTRSVRRWALLLYLSSILVITFGLVSAFLILGKQSGFYDIWLLTMGAAVALCGTQLALSLVNLATTLIVKPKRLPRMNFTRGIPAEYRTLVVVPTMLSSPHSIELLVEALEVRYLGNQDNHLDFMLLTDFKDAPTQHLEEDAELLNVAQQLITALNKRYASENNDIFFLCHRPREWNPHENIWMGKERKRGKLADLNNLLRENIRTPFSLIVGDTDRLIEIKYVITLDSDTQLPRESARQFIGTMAHPLNRPVLNKNKQCVMDGYGILQPRMAEALPLAGPTPYVRLCGTEFGVDPYTRAVSDVYQDVFSEGSFMGKGIYDVDIFQQVLGKRFPDNRILSHDFLEGCYLRSGFLSDVPLYESTPSSYLADAKRRTRWIRGDWQLISWLLPRVLNEEGKRIPNPLSWLSKLKLVDNLRRSLVPIGLLMLLVLSWTMIPGTYVWLITLAILILPLLVKTVFELVRKPREVLPTQHISTTTKSFSKSLEQLIFFVSCLPHEAWYSLIAIMRTLWRMFISKQHLLEWAPSDQIDPSQSNTPKAWIAAMWMGPVTALILGVFLLINNRLESLFFALPLLVLWFSSPLIARWLGQPVQRDEPKLDPEQLRFLHRMARKTWGFFETFITVENHWLPPDNYQEAPVEALARRTSPTNMGLSLLANLTAYDFGYLSMNQLLIRTDNALRTMNSLERYNGHFYNWYNTETLELLSPRYISTVDSGNLAGHLLTLRQGLLALPNDVLLSVRYLDGLTDTFDVIAASVITSIPLTNFKKILESTRSSFTSWPKALACCKELCKVAEQIMETHTKSRIASDETIEWSQKLIDQCHALLNELKLFAQIPGLSAHATLYDIAELALTNDLIPHRIVSNQAKARIELIESLATQAFSLAQMDVSFLYDEGSHLMTIGFNVDEQRRDSSRYDLLSSEARLGNFVSIAQGQVRQESWFALGRALVSNGEEPTLVSWSGSMFEYLMPLLVMPTYPGTLLDQTYCAAVTRQINYGMKHGVPWGISESGYNAVDSQFNYLYRAFGVPGLGLKRGLEEDLVIAPYATAMALMVMPEAACLNLQRLADEHAVGKFGFYEAIDFTITRLPRDCKRMFVRSFMTHHQAMSFLSFSYLLHHQPMQQRFVTDPLFQATLLLLQERVPRPTASYLEIPKTPEGSGVSQQFETSMRTFKSPNTYTPQIQLLSNGDYHLVISQAGGGYSRWKDLAVTRWREDSTCDAWGLFNYVRDLNTGKFWSTIHQPTMDVAEKFKAVFSEAHAEFFRTDKQLDIHTEIVVSPEDDIELRRVRIQNRSNVKRVIEFTSYAELVLAPQASDLAQPAFNNLFVETELLKEYQAILATRRPMDAQHSSPWLCQLLNIYCKHSYQLSYETDRARFVGRGRNLASPLAMIEQGDLSNTVGSILDPIAAIRCRVTLEPNDLVTFDLLTGMADTREQCFALVEKYQDIQLANRIFSLAWTHGQVLLHHLNISEENVQVYEKIASAIIYANNTYRSDKHILASNKRGQSSLWAYSISGDLPIVLLSIEDASKIELVQQLIQAQAYWRHKGLVVDLVILNEEPVGYRGILQDKISSLISRNNITEHVGNIVTCIGEQVTLEDRILLQSVARVVLSDKRGSLKDQLSNRLVSPPVMPMLNVNNGYNNLDNQKLPALPHNLEFYNGLGGFTPTGDEYIIVLKEGAPTPAPWVNILANPNFGTLVSESGQGYTWTENAHEFRLTPWDNDPIKDSSGEAFYLRDEETGLVWSPTALPYRGRGEYRTRHGFGYTVFEHIEDGIHSELWMYVAQDAPVKFIELRVRNDSSRSRWLSATGYVTWVLGDMRSKNAMHVVTELSSSGALVAQNNYNSDFGERTAFFDATTSHPGLSVRSVTGDRTEFIGRNGSLCQPASLKRKRLSGRTGAGLDPCGAIQLIFHLAEGQSRNILFTLGAGKDRVDADSLIQRYHDPNTAKAVLSSIQQYWRKTLSTVTIKSPDSAVNFLANGWLLYQVLSSRLWGRTGFYQSGGAFGFRDQLQDVMALTQVQPKLVREHLLLCAAHQFEEGDVQHWWHPPKNSGVRTRCSDDYLWLPFALCHYVETTGDVSVLDEQVPYLKGRPLNSDEESYYDIPSISTETASIYQHAVRAIRYGFKFGVHGLPLMGSGDWNDGMSLVGREGRGESVWLGFFLYRVLQRFAPLAERYGDLEFAQRCTSESNTLQQQIETHGWDGAWYRRAYFDDGTPLGSVNNTECRIDSIAQSWSVLSKAAAPIHQKVAMASLYNNLVIEPDKLVKLLTPPFDKSKPNPGYIQGYAPGVRENGGQYTHAGVWAAMAFSELGNTELAWKLQDILNPINHGSTPEEVKQYKIEPYVLAGDVYSTDPHVGRGGWSWYTGSAGWFYTLIIETLIGVKLEGGTQLHLTPTLPAQWEGFKVDYNFGDTLYKISINRVPGEGSLFLDNVALEESIIRLVDDRQIHEVTLNIPNQS